MLGSDLRSRGSGVGEGARTPSDYCRGTLKQGAQSSNVHKGPCEELAIRLGMDPAYDHMCSLLVTPKRIRWSRKRDQTYIIK